MKAKSISGKSTVEITQALDNCLKDGFQPTIAIVFISVKQDRKEVSKWLADKGIAIFGATSCGEFTEGQETNGAVAILLMELPRDCFDILFEQIGEEGLSECATRLAETSLKKFTNPSLILCSTGINLEGEYFDGETLVRTIEDGLGHDKIFYGGMAGDDWNLKGSYVFTRDEETDFGMIALVLDGDTILLEGMAITGWKPMDLSRTVTRSEGTKLYEIDHMPALDLYLKYLGKTEFKDQTGFDVFTDLAIEYPFIVDRGNNETVLRTPMKIDREENTLLIDSAMPEGTRFWFTKPPEFDIVEEIIDKAHQVKTKDNEKADALLIFSCAGRQPVLGPLTTEENEGLAKVWQTPMAGFFTYGEYGRAMNGRQHFHSGACCWVALKEKGD